MTNGRKLVVTHKPYNDPLKLHMFRFLAKLSEYLLYVNLNLNRNWQTQKKLYIINKKYHLGPNKRPQVTVTLAASVSVSAQVKTQNSKP